MLKKIERGDSNEKDDDCISDADRSIGDFDFCNNGYGGK